MGQWDNITDWFPIVPRCALQNVETCGRRIGREPSRRRKDVETPHIGEEFVGAEHAEDEP